MRRQTGLRAAMLTVAALALPLLSACGDEKSPQTEPDAAALLAREAVVPVSVVTQYFPDVSTEASTGPNETSVANPVASRSVVFLSADGKKKVTLSVDQYVSASDAASAYRTAVEGSKSAPGFKPAASPTLGQGVRRHLASRRRDAFWARRARRQAHHVGNARGRHSRHARQLQQPHQPRWRGTHHRQGGPWSLGEQVILATPTSDPSAD
jgi:hypothetical protein